MTDYPPESPPADPFEGRVLEGRFRVERKLGEGGMGLVYRGMQLSVEREVAIKFLHPAMSVDAEAVERFMREAKLVSQLRHPNSTMVLDFGRTREGVLWIAMELLKGRPLSNVIAKEGALRPARVGRLLAQVCDALAEAHSKGVVHRDLKPDNLFVLEGEGLYDTIKVLDFGVARVLGSEAKLTAQGAIVGTPYYMSPEQILGKEVDARADLYALGIIAYQLLTGQLPFTGTSATAILVKHLNDACPAPSAAVPGLDQKYDRFVARLVAKDAAQRPGNIGHVRELVEETFASTTSGLLLVPRSITAAGKTAHDTSLPTGINQEQDVLFAPTRPRWPIGVAAGVLVAGALAIGLWPTAPTGPPGPPAQPDGMHSPPAAALPPAAAETPTSPRRDAPPAPIAAPAPDAEVAPKATWGVTLSSEPPGAKVLAGDRVLGETPVHVELEGDPGATMLRLEREGYEPASPLASEAKDGKLHIELRPKGARPRPEPPPKRPKGGSKADEDGLQR